MSITTGKAVPYFDMPATETKDGTTYIQNFKVPLSGFATASAQQRSLVGSLALRANGIPQYGAQYAGDSFAFCMNRTTKPIGGEENQIPSFVIVTCTFTTLSVDKRDEEQSPLEKRPDIVWSSQFERKAAYNSYRLTKVQGNKKSEIAKDEKRPKVEVGLFNQWSIGITNSAGQFFQPFPEIDVPYPIVTIVQNLSRDQWDAQTNAKLIGSINLDPIRVDGVSIGKEQAFLVDRTARTMYQGKLSFREVTTTLLFKNTHDIIVADTGYKVLIDPENPKTKSAKFGISGKFRPSRVQDDGAPTPVQVALDGLGNRQFVKANDPAVMLQFSVFLRLKWDSLLLPEEKQ